MVPETPKKGHEQHFKFERLTKDPRDLTRATMDLLTAVHKRRYMSPSLYRPHRYYIIYHGAFKGFKSKATVCCCLVFST